MNKPTTTESKINIDGVYIYIYIYVENYYIDSHISETKSKIQSILFPQDIGDTTNLFQNKIGGGNILFIIPKAGQVNDFFLTQLS